MQCRFLRKRGAAGRAGSPSQALPRQLSQGESQAVMLVAKVLSVMRKFPAVLLALPLGELSPQVTERASPLSPQRRAFAERGAAAAVFLHDPTCENAMPERPQTLRHCSIKNNLSAATTTTAASGGNREQLLGQRPARCECRSRHDADAGCRNPEDAARIQNRPTRKLAGYASPPFLCPQSVVY